MSKYNIYVEDVSVEAVFNRLGGVEGARRLLRGELMVSGPSMSARSWREEEDVIYFWVKSDGTTGDGWITRLGEKGFSVSERAKQVLRSQDFKPTSGVVTEVAVLKGVIFEHDDRFVENIRVRATHRGFTEPDVEVACLIREKFTDGEIEAMGLWWIIAMHKPVIVNRVIDDLDESLHLGSSFQLLSVHRCIDNRGNKPNNNHGLDTYYGGYRARFPSVCGFAFAASKAFRF